jgi:hypothetical protein
VRKAASEKRRSKQKCHLCGQEGHVRRDCPGIVDDGRGESKFKKAGKGDPGASHLKGGNKGARGNRGHKNSNAKEENNENDLVLPTGFSAIQSGEKSTDADNNDGDADEAPRDPFFYYDAGCSDRNATIEYMRRGGKNKLSVKEAADIYQRAVDTASSTSNYGGCISRSALLKPGRPWNTGNDDHDGASNNKKVWFLVGLGRDFLYNDSETEAAASCLVETISDKDCGKVVGFFCDLNYSPATLCRPGCDRESQIRRLKCTSQAANDAGVTIQIRASPAADAASETKPDSSYSKVMSDLREVLGDIVAKYPTLKVHLSCWSGLAEHLNSLLSEFPDNVWVGMDGSVTFAKNARAHECAFDVPLSKLVLETGTPNVIPAAVANAMGREAFCHSGLIPYVAEALAGFKSPALDISAEQVARAASLNTLLLYPKVSVANEL